MSITSREEKVNLNLNVLTREAFKELDDTGSVLSNMLYMVVDDDLRNDCNRYVNNVNVTNGILHVGFNTDNPVSELTADLGLMTYLNNYLPLSGGTMTGGIKLDSNNWADLKTRKPKSELYIGVGTDQNTGGAIGFKPNDANQNPGAVELFASQSSSIKTQYIFQPNGQIVEVVNGTSHQIYPLPVQNTTTLTFVDFNNNSTNLTVCVP